MLLWLLLLCDVWTTAVAGSREDTLLPGERDSLAELPMEKLLHVKKALEAKLAAGIRSGHYEDRDDLGTALRERKKKKKKYKEAQGEAEELEYQQQLGHGHQKRPIRHHQPPLRRDSWEDESPWKSGKEKSDVQSIFQATITVLAFLAFGGYLLCLLLQAMKGAGEYYPVTVTPTTTTATTTTTAATGRKRRKRRAPAYGDGPETPLDLMISTLVTVAESYAKFERLNARS